MLTESCVIKQLRITQLDDVTQIIELQCSAIYSYFFKVYTAIFAKFQKLKKKTRERMKERRKERKGVITFQYPLIMDFFIVLVMVLLLTFCNKYRFTSKRSHDGPSRTFLIFRY